VKNVTEHQGAITIQHYGDLEKDKRPKSAAEAKKLAEEIQG
jgi:hypothetical protein